MAAPLKKVLDSAIRIDPAIITSSELADLEEISPKALHFIILTNKLIYQNSYFVILSEQQKEQMVRDLFISMEELTLLLSAACRKKIYDTYMYATYGVLTNIETQEFWLSKIRRRKNVEIYSRFLLIDKDLVRRYIVNNPNWIDSAEIPENHQLVKVPERQKPEPKPNPPYQQPEPPDAQPLPGSPKATHTYDELVAMISKPYDKYPDEFKQQWPQSWFESYVKFSNRIIEEYPSLLSSIFQIKIGQYKTIMKNFKGKLNEFDVGEVLKKMAVSGQSNTADMKLRFEDFAATYIEKRDKGSRSKKAPEVILHDGTANKKK